MLSSELKSESGLAASAQASMRVDALVFLGLSVVWLLSAGAGPAPGFQPSEYQLKAAFLFNFAKFVEWPPDAFVDDKSPIVIGVLGENPFAADLETTVRAKTISNRRLEVRQPRSPGEATNCHLLFISASERERLPEILKGFHKASVLTVGETDSFIEQGGMIGFVISSNKIRFRINDQAARSVGLRISSKLLSLALGTASQPGLLRPESN